MVYRTHRGEELSALGVGCYGVGGAYGAKDPQPFIDLCVGQLSAVRPF